MTRFIDVKGLNLVSYGHPSITANLTLFSAGSYGFLPNGGPLLEIESDMHFNEFVRIAEGLPQLISSNRVCSTLNDLDLPDFSPDQYSYSALLRVYSAAVALVHAYILEAGKTNQEAPVLLPKKIASWVEKLSHQVARLPTQTYETYILQNYRLIDVDKGYTFDNIEPLITYSGEEGEKWFIKVHVYAEYHAASAVTAVEAVHSLVTNKTISDHDKQAQLFEALKKISGAISALNESYFTQMKKKLTGEYFHSRLRPLLHSWQHGVIYENSSVYAAGQPIHWRGASGAESSFIPAIDLLLKLNITQMETMRDLENYMPPEHQFFLQKLRQLPPDLFSAVGIFGTPELVGAYNRVVMVSSDFRRKHYNLFVVPYIIENLIKKFTKNVKDAIVAEHGELLDEFTDIDIIISNLLKSFFTKYKEYLRSYHQENLLEVESREALRGVMERLKQAILPVTPESVVNDRTDNFELALQAIFKKIISAVYERYEFSRAENSLEKLSFIVDKVFDSFVTLSNESLGTGGEDFSLFLPKNIKDSRESVLPVPERPSIFASMRRVMNGNPTMTVALASVGVFAAVGAATMAYSKISSALKPSV